jgi:hypothetical protein
LPCNFSGTVFEREWNFSSRQYETCATDHRVLSLVNAFLPFRYVTTCLDKYSAEQRMFLVQLYFRYVGRVAQSVKLLATGWTVRGSNPSGGEIFRTCPERPWGPPSLYNGYRVFPGSEVRPGRAADHSHTSSAGVMEE